MKECPPNEPPSTMALAKSFAKRGHRRAPPAISLKLRSDAGTGSVACGSTLRTSGCSRYLAAKRLRKRTPQPAPPRLAEDEIKHALGAAARPFPSAVIAIGCGCLIDHRTIRKTWAGFRRDAGVVFMPCRFNAFITAIRASISGPSHSATSNSVSIAICQSAAACSAFGKLVMYSAASRSVSNLRPSGSTIGS
jgi:hypothetical protein